MYMLYIALSRGKSTEREESVYGAAGFFEKRRVIGSVIFRYMGKVV